MKIYYWHNPTNHRYYFVIREKNLFDDIVITHIAGGSKVSNRKILTIPMASRTLVAQHIKMLTKVRKRHDYSKPKIIRFKTILDKINSNYLEQ